MFGKLKELTGSAAREKLTETLEPLLAEHLAKAQLFGADVIKDDARFAQLVVEPTYLAITAASSGEAGSFASPPRRSALRSALRYAELHIPS